MKRRAQDPYATAEHLLAAMRPTAQAWHWFICVKCGEPIQVPESQLRASAIKPNCCSGNGAPTVTPRDGSPGRSFHAGDDAMRAERRCMACGYEKTFGTAPIEPAEEKEEPMAKKKTKAPNTRGVGSKEPKEEPLTTVGEAARKTRKGGARAAKAAAAEPDQTKAAPPAIDPRKPVERARYFEQLPVKVEDPELLNGVRDRLAALIADRKAWRERVKAENAKRREERAHYDTEIEDLGVQLNGRVEYRRVELIEYLLLELGRIDVIRSDTGEVVRSRVADASDRQEALALDEAAAVAQAEAQEAAAGPIAPASPERAPDPPDEPKTGDVQDPAALLAAAPDVTGDELGAPLQ